MKSNALRMLVRVVNMKRSNITDSNVSAEALKVVYNVLYSTRDEDITKEVSKYFAN